MPSTKINLDIIQKKKKNGIVFEKVSFCIPKQLNQKLNAIVQFRVHVLSKNEIIIPFNVCEYRNEHLIYD